MKIHELKVWPGECAALRGGDKTHEVREVRPDLTFRYGDILHLREWDPHEKRYTGVELIAKVGNITLGGTFGLPQNVCCMSVKVIAWELV